MPVLKEFTCKAHGPFEEFVDQNVIPECPKGCSARWVTREIRTAPAANSVITGKLDDLQRNLAKDFGLSDLKVDKQDGKSVIENLRGTPDFRPKWVDMPAPLKAGWSKRGEKPPPVNISSTFGVQADNALARVPLPKALPTQVEGRYKGEVPRV